MKLRRMNEAESYGYVVEDEDAFDAYEFACDTLGKEYVADAIVNTLSYNDLASSLAYLFRMWDFREWDNRNESNDAEDFEESIDIKQVKEARVGRTKEVKVLQGNWGYGWDDICEYDKYDNGECKDDLKAYRENDPTARYRVIFRRVPNPDYVSNESVNKRTRRTRK